ncbi:protein of unknown function (plasmid) [Cupriavidus neocaledonicus]|uniref:Uncharacterized protein n=1 Tax=Cupriavidus neocaledonicus TaxID=1040979 RepID=A0A375HNS2_9BURK|nr:protein of unknown function [Cupriavidus neocaledonicus]
MGSLHRGPLALKKEALPCIRSSSLPSMAATARIAHLARPSPENRSAGRSARLLATRIWKTPVKVAGTRLPMEPAPAPAILIPTRRGRSHVIGLRSRRHRRGSGAQAGARPTPPDLEDAKVPHGKVHKHGGQACQLLANELVYCSLLARRKSTLGYHADGYQLGLVNWTADPGKQAHDGFVDPCHVCNDTARQLASEHVIDLADMRCGIFASGSL